MAKLVFSGPWLRRIESLAALSGIAMAVRLRHAAGRRMAPDWDADFETGIRFWRRQFTRAMRHRDMMRGRALFESLLTLTDDFYEVTRTARDEGCRVRPRRRSSEAVVLYLHGGGYTFGGGIAARFADMLAHRLGAEVYAPVYRLTPEHPHPAQIEDALAAWRFLTREAGVPPERIVLIGDSAGGHLALMLLQALRREGEAQPALCVGLSPWTDVGARGASLTGNDRYDVVQGWMALQFGRWLDPEGRRGREALSPIAQDYNGLAPLYLVAGGREVLRDMIRDFAEVQAERGARVMLDLWEDMPHDFLPYDRLRASSRQALTRLRQAVEASVGAGAPLLPDADRTVVCRR